MKPQTQTRPPRRSKKDPLPREEKPASVPRYIGVKFMEIEGVTDVKPMTSTDEEVEVIVIPKGEYNPDLQGRILAVEREVREALKPKRQKFFASISW